MEFRLNTTFNCYYLLNLYYMSDKAKGFTRNISLRPHVDPAKEVLLLHERHTL